MKFMRGFLVNTEQGNRKRGKQIHALLPIKIAGNSKKMCGTLTHCDCAKAALINHPI